MSVVDKIIKVSGDPVGSMEILIGDQKVGGEFIPSPPRFDELRAAIKESILVLRVRDGLPITDAQAQERAGNIVTLLQGMGVVE